MRINWKNDEDAISTIRKFGLTPERKTIAVSEIDAKKSRHNHARRTAIIDQNVDDYADAMAAGDVFPEIVVARIDGAKTLVIAGGNHRYAAAIKNDATELDAIFIECDARTFELLCPALNLYCGQREDRTTRVQQAADASMRMGISIKQAAEEYRVPLHSVTNAVAVKKVIVEASKMGQRADDLAPCYLRNLAPIMTDATLLPLALELCRTKINAEDVRVAIKKSRELPTEADRIDAFRKSIADAKKITVSGRIPKQPVRASLMRSVTSIETAIGKGETLCALQVTKEEAVQIAAKLRMFAQKIASLWAGKE